jgi:hypothetical protein
LVQDAAQERLGTFILSVDEAREKNAPLVADAAQERQVDLARSVSDAAQERLGTNILSVD